MFFKAKSDRRSDEELVASYRATRNADVLSTLYLRYTSLIYGVCLKYLKDREEAKDAVMQIYESLSESLLKHDVDRFRGWVYVMARNFCLMKLRAARRNPQEDLSPLLMESAPEEHPEGENLENDLKKLEKCIEKLVAEQQRCVRMFFLEEICYRDIAVQTGFDLNQVKSYIQNGKRNLKICLESGH